MTIPIPASRRQFVGILHLRRWRIRIAHRDCIPEEEWVAIVFQYGGTGHPCYYCGQRRVVQQAEILYIKPAFARRAS